ncbi:MAG: urease accessory UreF family protein [Rhizomicrobium sp.]
MTTDADALYRLMSWLSPGFPVGAFSYSHGIEYAVEAGLVRDEEGLRDWIDAGLAHEFGPVNGWMLRTAYDAVRRFDRVGLAAALEEARAFVPTLEFELEHRAQGQAFVTAFRAAWHNAEASGHLGRILDAGWVPYPSAIGIAAAYGAIPLEQAMVAFFHSVASNMVSAGIRLVPLGQTSGQRIIASLQPAAIATARAALRRDPADIGTAAPVVEWASIAHETQYTRLFRS